MFHYFYLDEASFVTTTIASPVLLGISKYSSSGRYKNIFIFPSINSAKNFKTLRLIYLGKSLGSLPKSHHSQGLLIDRVSCPTWKFHLRESC